MKNSIQNAAKFLLTMQPVVKVSSTTQINKGFRVFFFVLVATFISVNSTFAIFTLAPTTQSVVYSSGSLTANLNTSSSWTSSSNVSWLTIAPTSGSSGNTNRIINYTQNPYTSSRTGIVTFYSQGLSRSISITQAGQPAIFTLTPTTQNVVFSSGSFTVNLNTSATWTASSNVSWLTISPSSGSSGNTNRAVYFGQNPNSTIRNGTVTFYSQGLTRTISISQQGKPAISVTSSSLSFNSNGGSLSLGVTTNNTAATISISNSNFTKSTSSIGTSSCITLTVSCPTNFGATRTGVITINGSGITQTISLTQSGGAYCTNYGEWFTQVGQTETMCPGITIHQAGCVLACCTMLHKMETSNSYPANVSQLNQYLKSYNGYDNNCKIIWEISANADGSGGLQYLPYNAVTNFAQLDAELAACHKVVLNVNNGTHWVLCVAKVGTSTYKILDPGTTHDWVKYLYPGNTTGYNSFSAGRSFSGTWGSGMYKTQPEEIDYNFDLASFENKIFPNPVSYSGIINFEIGSNRLQTVPVKVFDYSGKLISEDLKYFGDGANIGSIQAPEKPGLYFIIFQFDDNKRIVKKIIVE